MPRCWRSCPEALNDRAHANLCNFPLDIILVQRYATHMTNNETVNDKEEDRFATTDESIIQRALSVLTRDEMERLADFLTDDARGFLVELIDEASKVTTSKNALVFHYDRPIHRDVMRRWVLNRRGELPEGQ